MNAGPPSHVADTTDNFPYKRRADARRFFRTGNLSIVGHYGAHWIVVDKQRYPDFILALRSSTATSGTRSSVSDTGPRRKDRRDQTHLTRSIIAP